jgi:pentatricopeptide repeat protein
MSFRSGLIRLSGHHTPLHASHYASRTLVARASSTVTHDPLALGSMLVAKLKAEDGLSAIHTYYPALTTELRRRKTSQTVFSRQQLFSLLDLLGSSGRPQDLQRMEEILCDMSSIFGIEPNIDVHTTIIRALIKHGNVRTVHRWLYNMPSRPERFIPTPDQFHMFLEACIELESFKYMRSVVLSMRRVGCKPTNETFKILIRARWEKSTREEKIAHIIVFSTIIDDMKEEGLPYDPAIDTLLHDSYADRGFPAYADQIRAIYKAQLSNVRIPQEQQGTELDRRLSQAAQVGGINAAIKLFRSKQLDRRSPATSISILQHSRTIDDLRTVEKELDIKASAGHWSTLLNNNVRAGNISDAVSIYQEMKTFGIIPDPASVGSLIKKLCQSYLNPPSEVFLDHALSIYHDLDKAPSSLSGPAAEDVGQSTGPDADVYQALLRGLASSTNISKYLPLAKSLIADMEARNMSPKDSITASSAAVLLMRQSPTPSDALEVYQSLRSSLDEQGYAIVLNAFCKLSFGDSIRVPSLSDYFEIVKDMRRAGLSITVEIYTIFLRQLGAVATQLQHLGEDASADLGKQLVVTTRRTHDLLTLDAAVSPDADVWNQLMDTYQCLGCFADSYRVWDMMYLSGRFDHLSVSIILAACGRAGAWQVARNICAKLFNDHFSFNLHNWNTWLECLCRLAKLNDALKVACLEMGKGRISVAPDVESARILIKYSKQANQHEEVLVRIQRHLPELWRKLPEDLKQS